MANSPIKPPDKTLLPDLVSQNPAPVADSQDRKNKVRDQVDRIMQIFMQLVPSNYVSQVTGPFYTLQYQAIAERIADFQITAQETFADSVYDYTRPEFLYQILGALVFPDAPTEGWPTIHGDLSYREFLKRMVVLLLQGATPKTIKEGVELLTDATVTVIEKGIVARKLKGLSPWGEDDEFSFEVSVEKQAGTIKVGEETVILDKFPDDPITLVSNVKIVMQALKPAHTLYDFRFLFSDSFSHLFSESYTWDYRVYHYEDFRRYCLGIERVDGTAGETLVDRTLFSDPTRDFWSILPGAVLTVTNGPNAASVAGNEQYPGKYRVEEVRAFPVGDDPVPRAYTTTGGLSGTATVSGDVIEDPLQDWGVATEGEILTFMAGPNAGRYRLKTLMGLNGGDVGKAVGPATKVRVSHSILRLVVRMPKTTTGQSYSVTVDRLGVQRPHFVVGEDATSMFLL